MSKNNHRYKDDYRVDTDDLDALDELETVKFEKFHPKNKSNKSHGNKVEPKKQEQED